MAKYLFEVNYTLDGIKGVKAKGGSARLAAAKAAVGERRRQYRVPTTSPSAAPTSTRSATSPTTSPPPASR